MSAGHVCDECKTVAPIDTAYGWWHVEARSVHGVMVLHTAEKFEYDFCGWKCMVDFGSRMFSLHHDGVDQDEQGPSDV